MNVTITSLANRDAPEGHKITQIRTPLNIILECTCGWRRQITRRQNALARFKKIEAAVNRHWKDADQVTHGATAHETDPE